MKRPFITRLTCRNPLNGFTLTEVIVSIAITSMIAAALMTGTVALNRAFSATDDYATAQADQMRLSDYLAFDLRNAVPMQDSGGNTVPYIATNATRGVLLELRLPDYYENYRETGAQAGAPEVGTTRRPPQITDTGMVFYGNSFANSTIRIRYILDDGILYRRQDWSRDGVSKNARREIARNVSSFQLGLQQGTLGSVVDTNITFESQFKANATRDQRREGTTMSNTIFLRGYYARS